MNACGKYFGSVVIETLVRHSRPISPISEPSRAKTSDDCGGAMSCHASPVGVGADAPCATSTAGAAARVTKSRASGPRMIRRRPAGNSGVNGIRS
jgi:hypothetical protein